MGGGGLCWNEEEWGWWAGGQHNLRCGQSSRVWGGATQYKIIAAVK